MNDEAGSPIVAAAGDVPTDLRISIRSAKYPLFGIMRVIVVK
jgi:hypothetical protein